MVTEDKIAESPEEKIGMRERKGARKRGNPLARFFKVWATPLSILIAAATLLWSVYQFTAQQQTASQQAVLQQQLTRQQEAASAQIQATQEATSAAQTLDQQRQTTLDTYLDDMSNLLLMDHLKTNPDAQAVAAAWTYTALRNLDGARKGTLVRFLWEAGLISGSQPIISMYYVDLSSAIFTNADLQGANFAGANLSSANFSNSDLRGANLSNSNLRGANLSGAYLSPVSYIPPGRPLSTCFGPCPSDLNQPGADLSGADLSGANLYSAQVTTEQLAEAESLQGATMPDGSIHP